MCSAAGRGLIAVWTPAAKIRQVCSVTGGGDGEKDREGERENEWREGGKKRREGGVDFFVLFK